MIPSRRGGGDPIYHWIPSRRGGGHHPIYPSLRKQSRGGAKREKRYPQIDAKKPISLDKSATSRTRNRLQAAQEAHLKNRHHKFAHSSWHKYKRARSSSPERKYSPQKFPPSPPKPPAETRPTSPKTPIRTWLSPPRTRLSHPRTRLSPLRPSLQSSASCAAYHRCSWSYGSYTGGGNGDAKRVRQVGQYHRSTYC